MKYVRHVGILQMTAHDSSPGFSEQTRKTLPGHGEVEDGDGNRRCADARTDDLWGHVVFSG
jgi:hypothetical protein